MIRKLIDAYFNYQDQRPPVKVKRKTYLILAGLTGWMGGHRFYSKRYVTAILSLLFCWTGVPFVNALVDIMWMLPKEYEMDEEGYVII